MAAGESVLRRFKGKTNFVATHYTERVQDEVYAKNRKKVELGEPSLATKLRVFTFETD